MRRCVLVLMCALLFLPCSALAQQPVELYTPGTPPVPVGSSNPLPVSITNSAAVNETAASSGVLKATKGNLLTVSADAVTATTDLKLLIFDSATLPSDGAVTPLKCISFKGDGTQASLLLAWNVPLSFANGISIAVSSATACTTKTNVTATISGQVQ